MAALELLKHGQGRHREPTLHDASSYCYGQLDLHTNRFLALAWGYRSHEVALTWVNSEETWAAKSLLAVYYSRETFPEPKKVLTAHAKSIA
jgi:hypothetical protein